MNRFFAAYIASAKGLASERGLTWDPPCDEYGIIPREFQWDLTALVGMIPPPSIRITNLALDRGSLLSLNATQRSLGQASSERRPMPQCWRDLFLAVLVDQVIIRKNKPSSAIVLAKWVRHLAAAAIDTSPWAITPDEVCRAYNAALRMGLSGKNALNFEMTIRTVLDANRLTDIPALSKFCVPLTDDASERAYERTQRVRVNASSATRRVRSRLVERKSANKLPEQRAFWEMVRIAFTERPKSFSDAIRFAMLKIIIVTGFRIGEVVLLPFDWCRWREYVDSDGRSAGEKGGISRSLMIRHFAEKQVEDEHVEGIHLYENAQHVPPIFENVILETLAHVAALTEPLRRRLRAQVATGRLFPEYPSAALIPAHEMYTAMSGSALFSVGKVPEELINRYRETFDVALLDEIRSFQLTNAMSLHPAVNYLKKAKMQGLKVRNSKGKKQIQEAIWSDAYLCVRDVEDYVRATMHTKLPQLKPARLADGTPVFPYDLMFLMPVRNLIEGRNGGVLDPSRYFSVGRISANDIITMLDGSQPESIFRRYGAMKDHQHLSLDTHALRHLQTTELFRLGVADTIITKRFNRDSVAQSYEYDHRSLAEDLANVEVPPEVEETLGDNARQVYRMITAGKVSGPLIDEFHTIQCKHGDDAAFEYLNTETDGLHVTPYGFCINSFAVDPCPKHLECYNGCLHLMRSDVDEEREHLVRLRDRMMGVIRSLEALLEEKRSIGWRNQLTHARTRLTNIEKTLATRPGERPFPDGLDLSEPAEKLHGTSILDTVTSLRESDDR